MNPASLVCHVDVLPALGRSVHDGMNIVERNPMTTRAQIASLIDHTLLKPEATTAQVDALVAEAAALGTYSVCVSPSLLPLSLPDGLHLATVCGFPSGAHATVVKAAEAAEAAAKVRRFASGVGVGKQGVVFGALGRVFEDVVRLVDFAGFLVGIGVFADVGVILPHQAVIRLFDVGGAGVFGDAEGVVVGLCHVGACVGVGELL